MSSVGSIRADARTAVSTIRVVQSLMCNNTSEYLEPAQPHHAGL